MAVGETAGERIRRASANVRGMSRSALPTNDGHHHVPSTFVTSSIQAHRQEVSADTCTDSQFSSTDHSTLAGRLARVKSKTRGTSEESAATSAATSRVDTAQNPAQENLHRSRTQVSLRASVQSQGEHLVPFESSRSLIHPFNRPTPPGHVGIFDHGQDTSMSRPRIGRGGTGRDTRDGHMETDIVLNRVIEAVKKAKEHNDTCQRLGSQIVELEAEIKARGSSTPDLHKKLDNLYREMMVKAEQEKRVHDDEDIISNVAIIQELKTTDEPPRTGHGNKVRKPNRPAILESDVVVDSPRPSPSDIKVDILKGRKGTTQRSSSVASQGRSGTVLKEDGADTNRGIQAEKAGLLVVGAEVFYRFQKGSPDDYGVGIQCVIKKIWQDKKPVYYEVQDPEPDPNGKQNVHRAHARDLIPIPPPGSSLPTFPVGATVYARYPDTDTFYSAKVRGIQKGEYTLLFAGEEDDKEQPVEKRFVLDSKMR